MSHDALPIERWSNNWLLGYLQYQHSKSSSEGSFTIGIAWEHTIALLIQYRVYRPLEHPTGSPSGYRWRLIERDPTPEYRGRVLFRASRGITGLDLSFTSDSQWRTMACGVQYSIGCTFSTRWWKGWNATLLPRTWSIRRGPWDPSAQGILLLLF